MAPSSQKLVPSGSAITFTLLAGRRGKGRRVGGGDVLLTAEQQPL